MKRILALVADYLANALKSATIGAAVAVAVAIAEGRSELPLSDAGVYALIGVACGTCSKAAIEGAFALFGKRRILAYLLNAAVIAAVILALAQIFYGGFSSKDAWFIVLVFALPELASALLVRAGISEAMRFERAIARRHESFRFEDKD